MAAGTTTRPAAVTADQAPRAGLLGGSAGRGGGLLLLLGLVVLAMALSVAVGARSIGLGTVWQALTDSTLTSDEAVIVRELRVPRTVLGVLVGLALGAGGALMQGHTRNPLGDPGLLGVAAGASFAVVLAITLLGVGSPAEYVWFAFGGALLGSIVVFAIGSRGRGGATPVNLALAGTALTYLLYALVRAVLISDQQTLDSFRFWVVGALAGRDADVAWQVGPFIAVGLVLALVNSPALNTLALGEDVARGLGQRIWLARGTGIAGITLLTGAATAACGPIAFVGLVVPHVARSLTGPDHRWLVPYAALLGAALLLVADVIGRVVVRPGELQVGIVLALVGAPFFIALIRRRRLAAL
ncbi:iron chelate uptake ABC transporter family permease subunit [Modestobacter sp. I12A-02628]|uniref:Iron chelate uptake ABC transporter family permease subunit n=1 Tax=Goekera deserti TaxID=2497753 RepID=A0A7K3WA36_9ACTN|nr:iron chelate uptake ABC transporter family permease subunit [Goekera deserti]MPQ98890.1 iron chelate uptake ABC transporter family permease subunit [Goekera deserti]NDI49611.1 iron chelate uptake ABC transporter family permease subunit [Goekera deserti]NEL53196.1 iron chelate uptake ABC transporter family permease subunit [Goekera deserti]